MSSLEAGNYFVISSYTDTWTYLIANVGMLGVYRT